MALNIQAGDFLVVDSVEYPIRAVAHYEAHGFGVSPAFALRASVEASTKRSPEVSGGKRGAPTTQVSSLFITPLDPLDPETAMHLHLDTPYTTRQTFASDGTDYAKLIVEERRV